MPASATLHTFGDSILDCARYNAEGVEPASLVARELGIPVARHAVDGATVASLPRQARGVAVAPSDLVMLTVGGNDLLGGLMPTKVPGSRRSGTSSPPSSPRSPVGASFWATSTTRPSGTTRRTSSRSRPRWAARRSRA